MNAKDCPHGQTWVKRALGSAYDPDKVCPYTGRPLWPFPAPEGDPERWTIQYWREDGHLFRVRLMTQLERDWTVANWGQVQASAGRLKAWLASLRPG